MRFLDVCRNPDAGSSANHAVPYLLIVQGDYVAVGASRVVVPLGRPASFGKPIRDLMPVLHVLREPYVMLTPQIAGVPVTQIGPVVENLSHEHLRVRRALDILTGDL